MHPKSESPELFDAAFARYNALTRQPLDESARQTLAILLLVAAVERLTDRLENALLNVAANSYSGPPT